MNKDRRKALGSLTEQLDTLKGKLNDIQQELEGLRDEEQEYYDNMPESFQMGDKGQAAEEAIGYLDEAATAAGEAESQIDEVMTAIESACE